MPRGKPSLGFSSIKEAQAAVRAIVGVPANPRYALGEEFFHPLLQRLFVEQPYWCDPPGPVCTKFKWTQRVLPYGAMSDWNFKAYSEAWGGWKTVSWRKAVTWFKFDIVKELKVVADARISIITSEHRVEHPRCEHEGCTRWADHVHHSDLTRAEIVTNALAELTEQEFMDIKAQYDWWSDEPFSLPDEHKFMQSILADHPLGTLRSLCRRHHNDAHGHKTHGGDDETG